MKGKGSSPLTPRREKKNRVLYDDLSRSRCGALRWTGLLLGSVACQLTVSPLCFCRLGKSRVIHIRNIPNEASEPEVIQLGVQFGRVSNVLVLKGKNQAFLEMADENSAAAMVACLSANPPQVRGRTVYVQFSNHRELKTDQNHSAGVSEE